ncbi:MAG TPA: septal ring lytic transglycosylase RlpA family protein [Terracidiphilus sp.]|jgi:rare lipoprotein A|nr:septal ring lytic transglycosylase RlpA family protein [Terracidiphilus sp.]
MRRNANKVNERMPMQLWLLMVVSCVALAASILTFFPRTVLANALLPRLAAQPAPVASATPIVTAEMKAERRMPRNLLHGMASWYGGVFNGRKTASGETYNMYAMTACHPTLPFGTKIRVENRENHKAVVVRVTDRGLLYDGRVLDLSYAAAQKLDMVKPGVAPVNIRIVALGKGAVGKP